MFIAKKKNPLIVLVGMVAVMVMIVMGMQTFMIKPEEIKLPERGNVWNTEEELQVFQRKSLSRPLEEFYPSMKELASSFLLKERKDFLKFISLEVDWMPLKKMPYEYIGIMVPFSSKTPGLDMGESMVGLREFTHEGDPVWVYFQKPIDLIEGSTYMDLIFLGSAEHKGKKGWVGIAAQMHEFPEAGLFSKMKSDEVALNEVFDDMNFQLETRKVSSLALKHYFGKVQRKEYEKEELLPDVGFTKLMEQPDRYRGRLVEFTGTLIHLEKRMLPSNELRPGMEFYFQGYLLNSNKAYYVFRSLEKPVVEVNQVMTIKGYFLQRYSYENRFKRAIWGPLLVAATTKPEKDAVGMSSGERNGVITFILVLFVVLIWVFFRTNKINKKLKLKKPLKKPRVPPVDQST
jgi:hypothetical protein